MENEHELSYETLKRVYLGSYECYKSVGAEDLLGSSLSKGLLLLRVIEEEVGDEVTRRGYGMSCICLKLAWRMWKVFVVPRLSWRRRKICGHFKDQEMDFGACKKLVGEGGESLRCLYAM
nr:hypothetical protein [Tanacetum cinerariifolium]